MKKTVLGGLLVFSLLLGVGGIAGASMIIPASEQAKEHSQAPAHSPAISDNWELERVDFIHYARPEKSGKVGKGQSECFKLMGVKWKTASVDYVINPINPYGLSEIVIASSTLASAEVWDNETSLELFNNNYQVDYNAQYGVQNYQNAIVFGDYPNNNVIGVTTVWFTRRGKQIVEFDMLLNTDFIWGDAALNPAVMDLQNILTHELGHAIGLDDIYEDRCSNVTMYGYSGEGDIEKRSLEAADIKGLQQMYGI